MSPAPHVSLAKLLETLRQVLQKLSRVLWTPGREWRNILSQLRKFETSLSQFVELEHDYGSIATLQCSRTEELYETVRDLWGKLSESLLLLNKCNLPEMVEKSRRYKHLPLQEKMTEAVKGLDSLVQELHSIFEFRILESRFGSQARMKVGAQPTTPSIQRPSFEWEVEDLTSHFSTTDPSYLVTFNFTKAWVDSSFLKQKVLDETTLSDWFANQIARGKNEKIFKTAHMDLFLLSASRKPGELMSRIQLPSPLFARFFTDLPVPVDSELPSYIRSTTPILEKNIAHTDPSHLMCTFRRASSPSMIQDDWSMTIAVDKTKRVVTCIAIGLDSTTSTRLLDRFADRRQINPLSILLALVSLSAHDDECKVQDYGRSIFEVELKTRMLLHDNNHGAEIGRLETRRIEEELDRLISKLNGVISRLSFLKMRLKSSDLALQRLHGWYSEFALRELDGVEALQKHGEWWRRLISGSLAQLDLNANNARNQLDIVYNMLKQHNKRLKLDLAESIAINGRWGEDFECQRKNRATLGTLFMLGTFTSIMWSASAVEHLRSFWTFTAPMALVVLGTFLTFGDQVRRERKISSGSEYRIVRSPKTDMGVPQTPQPGKKPQT